jgi:hypothetical protein
MQPLLDFPQIHKRLKLVFSGGIPNLNYVTREMAAKTVFVMLYIDALEGSTNYLRPDQVTRMTDHQAMLVREEERRAWTAATMGKHKGDTPGRWYQANTREPIRDETLRQGLIPLGAAIERTDLPTTSSRGKYTLRKNFAALFDPGLTAAALTDAIAHWQRHHLSPAARARLLLHKKNTSGGQQGPIVTLPNGESRRLTSGPSSDIAKAVIEIFAPRFLEEPGLLWLSESAKKENKHDSSLAKQLGLHIEVEKNLPDIILVDTGSNDTLFVFVEIVASDGPITEERRASMLAVLERGHFSSQNAAFVTAYLDREGSPFRRTFPVLAWKTFAWCVTEPDRIICLNSPSSTEKLRALLPRENLS